MIRVRVIVRANVYNKKARQAVLSGAHISYGGRIKSSEGNFYYVDKPFSIILKGKDFVVPPGLIFLTPWDKNKTYVLSQQDLITITLGNIDGGYLLFIEDMTRAMTTTESEVLRKLSTWSGRIKSSSDYDTLGKIVKGKKLPPEWRLRPTEPIYRALGISQDSVEAYRDNKSIPLKSRVVTSWTTSLDYAERFAKARAKNMSFIVIKATAKQSNVLFNLTKPPFIHIDPNFVKEQEIIMSGNILDRIKPSDIVFTKIRALKKRKLI